MPGSAGFSGQYPTGACVVTGITQDGQPTGLAVGSFTSLSPHPPLVAFMPDKTSSSWPKIRPANGNQSGVRG
jgi:flavin reductase (DIM6/NTAB) family NADH-FMN oxidoreductase RutF